MQRVDVASCARSVVTCSLVVRSKLASDASRSEAASRHSRILTNPPRSGTESGWIDRLPISRYVSYPSVINLRYDPVMNFDKCSFCRKRIPKKARIDARYCSPLCRMNAARARDREKRVSERAQQAATAANLSSAQTRAETAKAAFLSRIQAGRLAAQRPSVTEDVWLTAKAEIAACDKLIAALQERRRAAEAQLSKLREPSSFHSRPLELRLDAPAELPAKTSRVGIAVLPGEFEGEAMVYIAEPVERGEFANHKTYFSPRKTAGT